MMRQFIKIASVIATFAFVLFLLDGTSQKAQVMTGKVAPPLEMPQVIELAKGSKQGPVTFNHVKHNSGEYSVSGPIQCIECHHTAQPAAELAKHPPLKTDWPAGRTTTLTLELFNTDAKGAGIAACRDCHAKAGQKPKLLLEIPVLKDPGSTTMTTLTNQLAFHRTCDACHFSVSMNRPESKVPNATVCSSCHKRST